MAMHSAFLRIGVLLFAVGCASQAPPSSPSPQTTTQAPASESRVLPAQEDNSLEFAVDVGCSETDLRVVIATLTWRGDRATAERQRVDITVFKNGFEHGLFATIPALREGRVEPAPALLRLERPPGRPFELTVQPRFDAAANRIVLEVRRLEPGLLYQFRLLSRTDSGWLPTPIIEVKAPVCVADERERSQS